MVHPTRMVGCAPAVFPLAKMAATAPVARIHLASTCLERTSIVPLRFPTALAQITHRKPFMLQTIRQATEFCSRDPGFLAALTDSCLDEKSGWPRRSKLRP